MEVAIIAQSVMHFVGGMRPYFLYTQLELVMLGSKQEMTRQTSIARFGAAFPACPEQ